MATRVFREETLELQDGTEVVVRPLTIIRLRKFMEELNKLNDTKDEAEALEVLFNCSRIALSGKYPELTDNEDKFAEVIDVPTIHKVIEISSGVKLNDPNLAAAVEALGTT